MGSKCSLFCWKRNAAVPPSRDENSQYVTDLREDLLPYPLKCTNRDERQVLPGEPPDDFIDLALDVFPVQCTDAGEYNTDDTDDFVDPRWDIIPVQCTEP